MCYPISLQYFLSIYYSSHFCWKFLIFCILVVIKCHKNFHLLYSWRAYKNFIPFNGSLLPPFLLQFLHFNTIVNKVNYATNFDCYIFNRLNHMMKMMINRGTRSCARVTASETRGVSANIFVGIILITNLTL